MKAWELARLSGDAITLLDHLSFNRNTEEILELTIFSRDRVRQLKKSIKKSLKITDISIAVQAYSEWLREADREENKND